MPPTLNASPSNNAFPSSNDLIARIRFDAREGRIWLDDQRMLLTHLSALGVLRRGAHRNAWP